ncbi:auxin-responsive protein IAA11-like [Diospyros lotus]|uniref:auxin-responsive protein IAA11-like n=1 Tax=Diospyros lotus TaxID=55363 RepID=UPI0022550E9D|nr:auxin-responsive protein IAA11-like [Diospyros lotus]
MKGNLGSSGGGGGGASSTSTVSREDNLLVLTSDESSPYQFQPPESSDLELGLGLSLGVGGQYDGSRVVAAKHFPFMDSKSSSSSSSASSSASSSLTKANCSAGTKRTADSFSPPLPANRGGVRNQYVGWPPVRAYRMNSLANQAKLPSSEEFQSTVEKTNKKNVVVDVTNSSIHKNKQDVEEKGQLQTSLFVKVNMDGNGIGRKVDLNAHRSYETLAQALENMFCRPTTTAGPNMDEHDVNAEQIVSHSKLLDGSSEFVLTYEDKEGDWMLVGDVPWGMFLSSVKRLRIMRTSEAKGFEPRFQERNGRQSEGI